VNPLNGLFRIEELSELRIPARDRNDHIVRSSPAMTAGPFNSILRLRNGGILSHACTDPIRVEPPQTGSRRASTRARTQIRSRARVLCSGGATNPQESPLDDNLGIFEKILRMPNRLLCQHKGFPPTGKAIISRLRMRNTTTLSGNASSVGCRQILVLS
jgi:hypothetical protein